MTSELATRILEKLSGLDRSLIVKVALADGRVFYLRPQQPDVIANLEPNERPSVILKSDAYSINSVLSSKMSLNDALTSKRLSLSGDIRQIAKIKQALD